MLKIMCFFRMLFVFTLLSTCEFATKGQNTSDDVPSIECRSTAGANETIELVCLRGPPSLDVVSSFAETISGLTVLDWQDEELDPKATLDYLPGLRRLSILNGNLQRIITPFAEEARLLEIVEISGTSLRELPRGSFVGLTTLRTLNLRNNALTRIEPEDLIVTTKLGDVYLAGNQWSCDESAAWLVNNSYASLVKRIADRDEMRCWSMFKGKPLLFVMEVRQSLESECRRLLVCDCELVYVVNSASLGNGNPIIQQQQQQQQQQQHPRQQRQFMAFASVNCSRRGFTVMPGFLPANTTTLHLEGNKISDLTPLKTNLVYRSVIDLYLDDNEIESVGLLDGTNWLEHFRLLSLRGNKMTDFATYALESVLPHSQTAASLYLGNNPWRCDCQITPGFQEFLIKYPYLIKDISDVRCSPENVDYFNRQIRELTRTEICIPPAEVEIYPLDVLNVFLAIVILWIFIKFTYDYYVFKNTGKLPAIVHLIP